MENEEPFDNAQKTMWGLGLLIITIIILASLHIGFVLSSNEKICKYKLIGQPISQINLELEKELLDESKEFCKYSFWKEKCFCYDSSTGKILYEFKGYG